MRRTDVRAVSHSPLPRCFWRTVVECKFDELKTVARTLIRDIYCAKLETIFLYVRICIVIAANLAIWLFKWAQSKQLTELSFNEICVCIDTELSSVATDLLQSAADTKTRTSLQLRAKCWQRWLCHLDLPRVLCVHYTRTLVALCYAVSAALHNSPQFAPDEESKEEEEEKSGKLPEKENMKWNNKLYCTKCVFVVVYLELIRNARSRPHLGCCVAHTRECGASGANFSSLMKINVYFFLNYTYRFCLLCVHRLEHTERTQRVEIDTLALTALMISVRIAATLDVCWPQLGRSESRMLMFCAPRTKGTEKKWDWEIAKSISSSAEVAATGLI